MTTRAVFFRGVDRAALAAGLAARLRAAGVAVGVSGVEAFAAALVAVPDAVDSGDARRLYWLARVTLVSRHEDLAAFDAAFDAVFRDAGLRLDPASRRAAGPAGRAGPAGATRPPTGDGAAVPGAANDSAAALPWISRARPDDEADDEHDARAAPEPAASAWRALATTPFEALDADGLAALGDRLEAAFARRPTRRSRRTDEHPRGRRVLPRATLARALAYGGEPLDLATGRARAVPRRLVVLVDVSRSMQPYATAYLHLARAAVRSGDAEVYAFSHTLTRLTPALGRRGAAEALDLATARVTDRFGGTRIATSIRGVLADRHAGGCRGAVVLVASDGWDADDPALLDAAMARLRLRAHRVVWVNPRVAAGGFAPLTGGMAAALPHCDALLPGHTLEAVAEVAGALGAAPGARLSSGGSLSSRGSRGRRGGSVPPRRRRPAASPGSRAGSPRSG
jgi:uncharacterized protein with von Willebrand factor type A (vWA) domain